jgi:hypothetical protein
MGPKPQIMPQRWPKEGTQAKEAGQKGMEQIREYYVPSHGALPGPHQPAMTDVADPW